MKNAHLSTTETVSLSDKTRTWVLGVVVENDPDLGLVCSNWGYANNTLGVVFSWMRRGVR